MIEGPAGGRSAGGCAQASPSRDLVVYKTPYCGCCNGWITHMRRAGFNPIVREVQDLNPIRAQYGVPFTLSSCHTALVGGYVVEGHVPPADVARLLADKPKAIGLTVPGMPIGSPGMETPSEQSENYATLLLLDRTGRTRVFAHHG
ncbi:conserved predicted metal-binding protein (plasmid) [Phenylobacterium zucineum HLK1]|uniref:Conserved predicted metal-binding protein n=1 Tax=Phenylobacterium zucineum (strain HLK1) TaxID=450851 RepID=B4RII3_PHEZH|nr:DUF411 domain-containing protein [Phenylobacterium zucineum]ACG80158.1 conserved predicted metal-binding protein [Phenylobacterium zucineum HLK1]